MPGVPDDSTLTLAERLGARAAVATISRVERLSPSLVEVTLHHELATQLAGVPGNDVMIRLRGSGGEALNRRYSVRSVDESAFEFTMWVTTAHEGVGVDWVTSLGAGDEVVVIGPRGKIALDPMADWHLFVGDTSSLGAFYRMAESIDPPGRTVFVVEVNSIDDAITPVLDPEIAPTGIFVERRGRSFGDPAGLLSALAHFDMPVDEGHAYVFGEYATSRAVRVALIDQGLEEGQIEFKAFWRAGVANQEHGEPPKGD